MYSSIGNKDKAIEAIQRIAAMKQSGLAGFSTVPWEKIYFHIGNSNSGTTISIALENLKKVTASRTEVDLNTGVLAWMRVGQIYDMKNRRNEAIDAYKRAIAFAPQARLRKNRAVHVVVPTVSS